MMPTLIRNPRDYFAIFDTAEILLDAAGAELPVGSPAESAVSSSHLELLCCKCVDTYVTVKRNQNQICWKYHKVGMLYIVVLVIAVVFVVCLLYGVILLCHKLMSLSRWLAGTLHAGQDIVPMCTQ